MRLSSRVETSDRTQRRAISYDDLAVAGGEDTVRSKSAERFLQADLCRAAEGGHLVLRQANLDDNAVLEDLLAEHARAANGFEQAAFFDRIFDRLTEQSGGNGHRTARVPDQGRNGSAPS